MTDSTSLLIVDDNPNNLRLLLNILQTKGYTVRTASSGKLALKTILKKAPTLILLDIMMPGLSGYEVCEALKEDPDTKDIPIIFISALNDISDVTRGFEIGAVDYITKPFEANEVLARVKAHLSIQVLQQQLREEKDRVTQLSEAAFEGLVIHDDQSILDANTTVCCLMGVERSTFMNKSLSEWIPSEHQEDLKAVDRCKEIHILNSVQQKIPVEIRTKHAVYRGQKVSVTAIRDLTHKRRMEQENQHLTQENTELNRENTVLKMSIRERFRFGDIIGRSPAMQEVYELIIKAAASDYNVFIQGESGTGKELIAQTLHNLSKRSTKPFVPVNCGAISESLFEREFFGHRKGSFTGATHNMPGYFDSADLGTLFLDEIGELPLNMQVKLLRVLETGEYTPVGLAQPNQADVRIISATNRKLEQLVQNGQFRSDLFFRIKIIEIYLPPLRERPEDISLIVDHMLQKMDSKHTISTLPLKVKEALLHNDWPGNVRQLQNALQRYLATGQLGLSGGQSAEKEEQPSKASLKDELEKLEHQLIAGALERSNWHRGKASKILQIPTRSLQRKMLKYGFREA